LKIQKQILQAHDYATIQVCNVRNLFAAWAQHRMSNGVNTELIKTNNYLYEAE
jgi:hypothetical protein